jgi:glutamyl-tRNA reductase
MSAVLPWALVAQAEDVEVDGRARLASELEELAGFHPQWTLLGTCHRVEVYGFGPSPVRREMRSLEGTAAVRHLFRVAAGLESAVVGESEVLGQVRDALAEARRRGTDERVARLFETAIAVGRSARSRPLRVQSGLADRAVEWLSRRAGLAGAPVLIVGTGVMGSALAAAAAAAGGVVTLAGRSRERASLDLKAAALRLPDMAAAAVALRGRWTELEAAVGTERPLPPLADLSAPSAVPASVRAALGPNFLGIDQLWSRGPAEAEWAARAQVAVEDGVHDYMGWLSGRGSVETLIALRERGEARRRARIERLFRRLPDLGERERALVEAMTRQLVTDLLHEPVSSLRADADGSHGEAARRLFSL